MRPTAPASLTGPAGPTDVPPTGRPRRAVLNVLAAAALFGTTGTVASFAPAAASPVAIGAARLVIGGAALLLAVPLLGGRLREVAAAWRTRWGLTAGLMTALYQLTFFAGVERAGVALGTLVTIGSGPVLVGLLSIALLGQRPGAWWWLATAICIGGLGLLSLDGADRVTVDPAGLLLALAAGLAYAAYTVAAKLLLNDGVPSGAVMAAAFGLGGVLMLPVLVVAGAAWLDSGAGAAVALWLGLATTTLAYVVFGRGLRVLPAGPTATLVLAEPLVATLLGVIVLGERLGALGWLGAALVMSGVAAQALVAVGAGRGADGRSTD
jgi:drug/metabolite transporter, DME family